MRPKDTDILSEQTEQLYSSFRYSAVGTLVVAIVMTFIYGNLSDTKVIWSWFAVVLAVGIYRSICAMFYFRSNETQRSLFKWRLHYVVGAYLAALAWASSIWLFYPVGHPEYQALLILNLAGIAGGAIASQSYDKSILTGFQGVLFFGIMSRLLWEGGQFSYELATLIFLFFVFLIKGGWDIGKSYFELLVLRRDSEQHNLTLLSTTEQVANIGYWQWDMVSSEIELSENLRLMCGFDSLSVDMDIFMQTIHIDDQYRLQTEIENACQTGQKTSVEFRMRAQMEENWIIMNQVTKLIDQPSDKLLLLGTVQDISSIKSAEQKIFDMAYYDELTGLANRGHFHEYLQKQIKHAARTEKKLALLYLDLDGFKEINDTLGHDKGDHFLKEFSQILKQQVRADDFVSRLGGDEFCLVLSDFVDGSMATISAERCLSLSNLAIQINHQHFKPQMSIGISIYPTDGQDVDTLLRAADTAMYHSKQNGKNCFTFYNEQMRRDAISRLELESDLKQAIAKNEFYLLYQPKISMADGSLASVEALIRWQHPERGFVPPDRFIDTAERIGLINQIGDWVLETACKQMKQWKSEGLNLTMAVNISSSHFGSEGFAESVNKVKQQFDISDNALEIEITESVSRAPQDQKMICRELHKKNICVAIDDFGTGYSSLSVIKQLEIDTLKVDKSFIDDLPDDSASVVLVRSIVNIALGLGFEVVAEGVETKEQVELIRNLKFTYIQGYYFSRPVPAKEISTLARTPFLLPSSEL
jgi:diguanylate cyclase (GGDEF)-like protein